LKEKGLVEFKISEEGDPKKAAIFGKQSLELTPTEKGKDFLVELGLTFDGKRFVNTPD